MQFIFDFLGFTNLEFKKKNYFIFIFISLHSAAQNLSIAGSDNFF